MENLTLLEHESLEILKQLEYCCESAVLHDAKYSKKAKSFGITFGDLDFSVLKRGENIHNVEKYLQKNGVDFHITFDLVNDLPMMYIDHEHPTNDFIELGIIKGENIEEIKSKIIKLIDEISAKIIEIRAAPAEPELKIRYNINLGQFTFNDEGIVKLEGKQKDTAECLVSHGKDVNVSWDEIHDHFNDSVTDQDIPNAAEMDKRKRSVRTAVTGINIHTKMFVQINKELIGAKGNEYRLQYEVDKGR